MPKKSELFEILSQIAAKESADYILTTRKKVICGQLRTNKDKFKSKKALKTLTNPAFSRLFVMAGAEGLEPYKNLVLSRSLRILTDFRPHFV